MDFTSAYSEDLSSVLRLTTWERNFKVNRQIAEPRNKPVQCSEHEHRLWWKIIIIHQCQTVDQKRSSSEAFLPPWGFFKEGRSREASRKQKDILFMADWWFLTFERVCSSLKDPVSSSTFITMRQVHFWFWCFGRKLILNSLGRSLAFHIQVTRSGLVFVLWMQISCVSQYEC